MLLTNSTSARLPVLRFERQVLVADVAVALQPVERRFALLDVAEQSDLPQLLADQFLERVAEEVDDEGIGVDDLSACRRRG